MKNKNKREKKEKNEKVKKILIPPKWTREKIANLEMELIQVLLSNAERQEQTEIADWCREILSRKLNNEF